MEIPAIGSYTWTGSDEPQYGQGDGPEGQVVEHRAVQPGAALQQPAAPGSTRLPGLHRSRHTGEEEQRHDLEHPGQRLEDQWMR